MPPWEYLVTGGFDQPPIPNHPENERASTMAPVFRKFLNRFVALFDSINRMRGALVRRVRPRLGDFGSLTVCPSCHRITSKYKALCLECGRSLKTGLPEWDDSGKPIVDT